MRVIGIDPGLARVGVGVVNINSAGCVSDPDWLTIETAAGTPPAERLREIRDDLTAFIRTSKPELAVLERLFLTKNERTVMDIAHARGVILLTLAEQGLPVIEPTPSALKAAITGDGRADKVQIQEMLKRMFHLSTAPRPDDAADALALAIYGAFASRGSALTVLQ